MLVLGSLSVVADRSDRRSQVGGAGYNNTAITRRPEILCRIEAKCGSTGKAPRTLPFPSCAVRLTGVLDDRNSSSIRDLDDRIDVTDSPEHVYRHNCPSAMRERRFYCGWVHPSVRIALHQHGDRPGQHDRAHRGNEGIGLGDHFVTRADVKG